MKLEGLYLFIVFVCFLISFYALDTYNVMWPLSIPFIMLLAYALYLNHFELSLQSIIRDCFKYKLSEDEKPIWLSIQHKAEIGYIEWIIKTQGDDMCGPWISDITHIEKALIDKIHKYFYENDYPIAMPIGVKQVYYIMYDDIKDKVKYVQR